MATQQRQRREGGEVETRIRDRGEGEEMMKILKTLGGVQDDHTRTSEASLGKGEHFR